jgi:glucosyl-dolichyl phosphate glucuronosyltransferase
MAFRSIKTPNPHTSAMAANCSYDFVPFMEVSIIIPTYNRSHTLGTTLRSLVKQTINPNSYEILVMDNNSTDQTADVVREIQAQSDVSIVYKLETRQGVHYARNRGALLARGEILYYTDDDMIADEKMLFELLSLFRLDPKIASATGRVLPKWQSPPPVWVKKFCENSLLSLQLRSEELVISPTDVGVYSCHQAVRKSVLIECGGFNPENTGGEWVGDGESGLSIKIGARGYKYAFTAKSVTYHIIPPERMTQRYLNRRHENQGFADTYTWFRAERPDSKRLFQKQLNCVWDLGKGTLRLAGKILRGRPEWRLYRAQLSYVLSQFKYASRLRRDSDWRAFVLRDDWISID